MVDEKLANFFSLSFFSFPFVFMLNNQSLFLHSIVDIFVCGKKERKKMKKKKKR
jgi:hypothetical protein